MVRKTFLDQGYLQSCLCMMKLVLSLFLEKVNFFVERPFCFLCIYCTLPDMDIFYYMKFLSAFVFVIALMLILGAVARRFSAQGGGFVTQAKTRRLNIVEQRIIDSKHRLVLVQRDDVEHLLLVGAENDLLVESNIKPKAKVKTKSVAKPKAASKAKATPKSKSKKRKVTK